MLDNRAHSMPHPGKPTPDELLAQLQFEEHLNGRGHLKVFLGYASGVGKSFRMFDEGRRRRERGQDVVVAAVQAQNARELVSLMQRLEIIPTRNVRGVEIIDLDQIRARRPQVCLIDGLAHDNPPESKNSCRWQDVEEILDMGISVLTTINLEFVAELQAQVWAIRQKKAAFSVPLAFLYKAEEIVVVDAPADHHITWLSETYVSARPESKERKLSQLRELALLLAADVVDKQLEAYLQRNGVSNSWGTQERFLVCVTSRSPIRRMMQRAQLARQRFHGALFALHVNTYQSTKEEQTDTQQNLEIAKEFGAEIVVLNGKDEVTAIVEFARKERITQIFIGHSQTRSWKRFFISTTAYRIIRAAEGIDVKLFPH